MTTLPSIASKQKKFLIGTPMQDVDLIPSCKIEEVPVSIMPTQNMQIQVCIKGNNSHNVEVFEAYS
jgi:hypothetical protein